METRFDTNFLTWKEESHKVVYVILRATKEKDKLDTEIIKDLNFIDM